MDTMGISFFKNANKKHKNQFDYSLVEYVNSQTKVKIICKKHGIFEQTPNNHLSGQKCPSCYGNKKLNEKDFIKKSNTIHNHKYDYSLIKYTNNKIKVEIICKEHGNFNQTPNKHLSGQGCPNCDISYKLDVNTFIKKSNTIHNHKYDYSMVNYINTTTKITIICKKHGLYEQTPKGHLMGNGCSICSGNKKSNIKEFIKKSNVLHNYKYDYSLSNYTNAITKVKIICKEHGLYEQTPNKHLNGRGCPKCGIKYGLMENKWLDIIGISKTNRQVKVGNYIVDGIDKNNKIIYEFNGDFWHGNPKIYDSDSINNVNGKKFGELYNNTMKKEKYLKSKGYQIISIWESDFLKKY